MSELVAAQLSLLSPEEARRLTDEVKQDAAALWRKLIRLYKGLAHEALGYSSWGAYFEAEFDASRRRGYELLEAGRVVESLSSAEFRTLPANEAQVRTAGMYRIRSKRA